MIYNKKAFVIGILFILMGVSEIGLCLYRKSVPAGNLLTMAMLFAIGISELVIACSQSAYREAQRVKHDPREILLEGRVSKAVVQMMQGILFLGTFLFVIAGSLLDQMVLTGLAVFCGLFLTLSFFLELGCTLYYNRKIPEDDFPSDGDRSNYAPDFEEQNITQ